MKMKKLFIITTFLFCTFLVCSFNIYSKASTKEYTLNSPFYDSEFFDDDFHILSKGYYLITGSLDMEGVNISGNVECYYNYIDIDSNLYLSNISVEPGYEQAIEDIVDWYYDDFGGDRDLSIFLRVDNYARIIYKGDYETVLYCYGAEIHQIEDNKYHVVNFDDKLPPTSIIEKYSFSDNVDSLEKLQVNTATTYFKGAYPGHYEFYVEVIDQAGNVTTVKDYIYVHDFTAPTITSTSDHYELEVNTTPLTSDDIFNSLTIKDNITTFTNMKKEIADTYNSQYNVVGDYSITYTMTDSHKNSTTKIITITIKDTTAPTISLKAGGNTIYTNHDLSNEEIFNLLDISDNYDNIEFEDVSITSTSDGLEGVEYEVTVSVTDSNNNTTEAKYIYYINDTTPPNITVRDTVYLEKGRKYTTEEIISILRNAGLINDDAVSVNIINEELLSSSDTEDVYSLTYEQVLQDGSIQQNTITLKYQKENTSNNYTYIAIGAGVIVFTGILLIIIKRKKKHHASN